MDKTTIKKDKEFEKYLRKITDKYSKILLMDKHTWDFKYPCEQEDSLVECKFNYPYLNVTLNYGDNIIKRWKNNEDVIPWIVHEMCHPITDPLYSKATSRYVTLDEIRDEREGLTDYICNIVIKNKL